MSNNKMQSHAIEDTRDGHQLVTTNLARTSSTPWILSRDTYRGAPVDAWELEMENRKQSRQIGDYATLEPL
jgi:hypothetical protein